MTHDTDPLASLSPSEIAALALKALDANEKAKARSQKQRDAKKEAGLVPITTYVPAARADYVRHAIKSIVKLSDEDFATRSRSKRP